MCDPVSVGLMAAGTALSMYGQTQVAGAQKKSIAASSADYEAERGRQAGFQAQNAGTVADTLNTYSPVAAGQRMDAATENRQAAYTAPIAGKNYVTAAPADYDPNSAIAARNAATGNAQKAKDLAMANAKGKVDAFGDATQLGNILAANNANQIGMTNRIASGSEKAEAVQQGVLPAQMQADQSAGATASGVGDLFKLGSMIYGANPTGIYSKLFGGAGSGVGGGIFGGAPVGQTTGPLYGWS